MRTMKMNKTPFCGIFLPYLFLLETLNEISEKKNYGGAKGVGTYQFYGAHMFRLPRYILTLIRSLLIPINEEIVERRKKS